MSKRETERVFEVECRGNCRKMLYISRHSTRNRNSQLRIHEGFCEECVPDILDHQIKTYIKKKDEIDVVEEEDLYNE